uniref:Uncharacterized protein n=1 Tax=Arundo donax TaxID=35708 RepID=A0A0A9GLZ0_ARUDO
MTARKVQRRDVTSGTASSVAMSKWRWKQQQCRQTE